MISLQKPGDHKNIAVLMDRVVDHWMKLKWNNSIKKYTAEEIWVITKAEVIRRLLEFLVTYLNLCEGCLNNAILSPLLSKFKILKTI